MLTMIEDIVLNLDNCSVEESDFNIIFTRNEMVLYRYQPLNAKDTP